MFKEKNKIILEDLDLISKSIVPWTNLFNKTILITGCSGLIGSYLVKTLIYCNYVYDLNIKIVGLYRDLKSIKFRLVDYVDEPNLILIKHDVEDTIPSNFPKSDFIIHAASQASPKRYGVDPVGTILANSKGTENLLNYARRGDLLKFLFFSSGEIYGDPINPNKLIGERDYGYLDPINIRSCYAESKRLSETMAIAWGNQYGIKVNIVRPFHTYGPGINLNDGRVFADFVSDVVQGNDILVKSDGLSIRPFCYISDAIIGFFLVLLNGKESEAYNIGNPSAEISIKNLASLLVHLRPELKLKVKFIIKDEGSNYLKSEVKRACPSIQKISNIGWEPIIGVREGFDRTIKSFLEK